MAASYTIREYCVEEKISRSKVYEEIAAGRIAVVKVGRKSIIYEEERQRYRAERLAEARRIAHEKRQQAGDADERRVST